MKIIKKSLPAFVLISTLLTLSIPVYAAQTQAQQQATAAASKAAATAAASKAAAITASTKANPTTSTLSASKSSNGVTGTTPTSSKTSASTSSGASTSVARSNVLSSNNQQVISHADGSKSSIQPGNAGGPTDSGNYLGTSPTSQ